MVALDIGALFLALPQLTADLDASSIEQLWITDIYGFMTAGFLITMGTLGDRVGRRRLLMIGAAALGVASVLATFATSAAMLIAARALLGIAGATLGPSTLALISTMFRDPKQRGMANAAWVTWLMAGAAPGPVVGGVLLERFRWGSVFLLAVPVTGLLLLVGPVLLPEFAALPEPDWTDRDAVAGYPTEQERLDAARSVPFDEAELRRTMRRAVDRSTDVRCLFNHFAVLGDQGVRGRLAEITAPSCCTAPRIRSSRPPTAPRWPPRSPTPACSHCPGPATSCPAAPGTPPCRRSCGTPRTRGDLGGRGVSTRWSRRTRAMSCTPNQESARETALAIAPRTDKRRRSWTTW